MLQSMALCVPWPCLNCCVSASAHPSFFLRKGGRAVWVASPVQSRGGGTLPVLPRGSPPSSICQKLKQDNCAPSLEDLAHYTGNLVVLGGGVRRIVSPLVPPLFGPQLTSWGTTHCEVADFRRRVRLPPWPLAPETTSTTIFVWVREEELLLYFERFKRLLVAVPLNTHWGLNTRERQSKKPSILWGEVC